MLYYITITFVLVGLSVSSPIEERIIRGHNAYENEFPFIVSVRRAGEHVCGGVIIDLKWVLTCGHCVLGQSLSSISLQYGSNKIGGTARILKIKSITIHEDYRPDLGKENDLALLELPGDLSLSPSVQVASLPKRYATTPTGVGIAILAGWGSKKDGGVFQTSLMRVYLTLYTNEECAARHYKPILSTDICTGVDYGGWGQCTGDAGGPVLVDDLLVGIISWSIKPCTVAPHPGVSMRVSSYICWINKIAKLGLE